MTNTICARRKHVVLVCGWLLAACGWTPTASAETITLALVPENVAPNETFSVLVKLEENTTRLYGYTLDVNVTGDAVGQLAPADPATNFYLGENLIDDAPAPYTGNLVGTISSGGGAGDLDIFAMNDSDSYANVTLAGPGHDVLAELVFTVLEGAEGTITIDLGASQLITNVSGDPPQFVEVAFDYDPVTIDIVPEPSGLGLLLGAGMLLRRRRRFI